MSQLPGAPHGKSDFEKELQLQSVGFGFSSKKLLQEEELAHLAGRGHGLRRIFCILKIMLKFSNNLRKEVGGVREGGGVECYALVTCDAKPESRWIGSITHDSAAKEGREWPRFGNANRSA